MIATMMKKSGTLDDDADGTPARSDAASLLAAIMRECGFDAGAWKGERVYLSGYGAAIRAYLTIPSLPLDRAGAPPCDGASLIVTSFWKSTKSGLHAKGVKHAILMDLYAAGLISEAPPARWQDVSLEAPLGARRAVRVLKPTDNGEPCLAHDQIV